MSSYIIKILFLSIKNTSPQNQIFQANSSLFQSIGRPALGGQSTDMHNRAQVWASSRPVHRPVDRLSRPGAHLELQIRYGRQAVDRYSTASASPVDRQSTGRFWSSRTLAGRLAVDRHSAAFTIPGRPAVDRRSTGSRPEVDRQAKPGPEFCFLFGFKL